MSPLNEKKWLTVREVAAVSRLGSRAISARLQRLESENDPRVRWANARGGPRREIRADLAEQLSNGGLEAVEPSPNGAEVEYLREEVELLELDNRGLGVEIRHALQELSSARSEIAASKEREIALLRQQLASAEKTIEELKQALEADARAMASLARSLHAQP